MSAMIDEFELMPFVEGVWTAAKRDHRMLGIKLGTRMTVAKLASGALVVHSPIALSLSLRRAIEKLGAVRHIVAPNLFHHVYAGEAQAAWPRARFHAPRGLDRKRPDLRIDSILGVDTLDEEFRGALEPITIAGMSLQETVFVHGATRTVVSSDLFENFSEMDDAPTRLFLRAQGLWKKPGWGRFFRALYRDRRAARRSVDQLLEHPLEHAVIAHGDPLRGTAKEVVRSTFRFLDP
jgi:hypothetical protein